ncbi:hypothetical protein BP6252_11267 [Coleophoma cylindrospora]|uniref:HIT domain-containing protein n=1 Tax=Coleophoma cylindrospora TaxID=1849047 RepID=A0A3D8QPK4_9HELO|nr:hypothetical protein BP6252_11267 [Coleophoma cylindrospora]
MSAATEIRFVLHAGTFETWETNETRQFEIQGVIGDIAETARKQLLAGSPSSIVVKSAIASLKTKYEGSVYGVAALDSKGDLLAEGSDENSVFLDDEIAILSTGAKASQFSDPTFLTSKNLDDTLATAMYKNAPGNTDPLGVIVLSKKGLLAIQSSARYFLVASGIHSAPTRTLFVPNTLPVFPQHVFYDDQIRAGLSRYPISPGHTYVLTPGRVPLMDLSLPEFLTYMESVRSVSKSLCAVTKSKYCGLVSTGDNSVALLPFPKLERCGDEIPSDALEYYPFYPGYLSSKNGPKMDPKFLDDVTAQITAVTNISSPFDKTFFGDKTDNDLMARLVRGDLPQHRFWENKQHVALISPKGKCPGYSIVVPRKHLRPDILNMETDEYTELMEASHAAAQALKKGLGVRRCGIFFEGFEGEYAHTKIIPIHNPSASQEAETVICGPAPYSDDYQGYLTTQLGPRTVCLSELESLAGKIQEDIEKQ